MQQPAEPEYDRALALARAAAAACGVTRLADITRLDRVGVPVFHAIRPRSRSLCVHQGKGMTAQAAQLGALMEAVESAAAEAFDRREGVAAWEELDPARRPADLGDFARRRRQAVAAEEPIAWCAAERLADGAPVLAPFDSVSLDCERPWEGRLDHTSNGLGARFDFEGALLKGLLEVLERDALADWRRRPLVFRAACAIAKGSITSPWFHEIEAQLREAGLHVTLYRLRSVIGLPAVGAEVRALHGVSMRSAVAGGWACAATADEALKGAVLEALQCRLTAIAGARDDILHTDGRAWLGETIPLPPGQTGVGWETLAAADETRAEVTGQWIAERLAEAGYPGAMAVRLSGADDPVCVVKAFAPGLGMNLRIRRAPGRRRMRR